MNLRHHKNKKGYLDQMIIELQTADSKNIMVLREKLHHYRWLASKLIGIYGDKQEIHTDSKVEITWNIPEQKTVNVTPGSPVLDTH